MAQTIMKASSKENGVLVELIAWSGSRNAKTGPMVQTAVIPSDMIPTGTVKDQARGGNAQESVCGKCRFIGGRGCYVNTVGLNGAARSARAGEPMTKLGQVMMGHDPVRWTAWGDATVLPYDDISHLLGPHDTGYTHRWRECDQRWRDHLMASVETDAEEMLALSMGWCVYRIMPEKTTERGKPHGARAMVECPHDVQKRAGKFRPVQCLDCGLCGQKGIKKGVSVWCSFKPNATTKQLSVAIERDNNRSN